MPSRTGTLRGLFRVYPPFFLDHRMEEGVELVLSDWFYHRVVEQCTVLTIDRAYFNLSGGFDERRFVRPLFRQMPHT